MNARLSDGAPEPLGLTLDAAGANVAVFSAHAEAVDLCLFDADGRETRRRLPARTGAVWHGFAPGIQAGQAYGFRAYGPYAPVTGHRFNPAKLLLDPYARALSAPVAWHEALVGDDPAAPGLPDQRDTAAILPKCLAVEDLPPIDPDERPSIPWDRTVIYEAHVKGLTRLWPGIGEDLRGRFEALADARVIKHLTDLGVTAIELLPVHAFTTERHLARRGLNNYWGYNSVSFFAPDPRLLGPGGVQGLRETVRRLHGAGIEVLLDVVYNHTGESDAHGPTLSFRGLDNVSYYRSVDGDAGGYANDTGCGNTVDLANPMVLRLVLDSLRWWATRIGVDGFRFDLAPALTRGANGFAPGSAFLAAVLQDPELRGLKLIAEPWDIGPGGYRLGRFPAPFAEWNDRFRDAVRGFWIGAPGAGADIGDALLGSARTFDANGRPPWSSVNAAAMHDGFTLADVTSYAEKHNEANCEDNRDGHNHNLSDNMGVEGPTDRGDIIAMRQQRQRNMLAMVFLAHGTPMLAAGDEVGHSQNGNNNAYCQDNETTWIDWAHADTDLLAFVQRLIALRADEPVFRQSQFLHGAPRGADGLPDIEWLGLAGGKVDWQHADTDGLALLLRPPLAEAPDRWALIAINPGATIRSLVMPDAAGRAWRRELDTAAQSPGELELAAESIAVFLCEAAAAQ